MHDVQCFLSVLIPLPSSFISYPSQHFQKEFPLSRYSLNCRSWIWNIKILATVCVCWVSMKIIHIYILFFLVADGIIKMFLRYIGYWVLHYCIKFHSLQPITDTSVLDSLIKCICCPFQLFSIYHYDLFDRCNWINRLLFSLVSNFW